MGGSGGERVPPGGVVPEAKKSKEKLRKVNKAKKSQQMQTKA